MKLNEMKARISIAWGVLTSMDGNLVAHTERELKAIGYFDGNEMNAAMANNLLALMRVFSSQGHSGFSASYCRQLFNKVAAFDPLGPLMGDEQEWRDLSEMNGEPMWQNNRCGRVFRYADGSVYDTEAIVFQEPDGSCFTSRYSKATVTFPYVPKTVYAKVPRSATEEQKRRAAEQALSLVEK